MKRIVLTGGGTAGHVTPNIALMPRLREKGYDIVYIGSHDGIERQLIGQQEIPYYGISVGKLRRYFDLKNFSDPFRVVKGIFEAYTVLKKVKPDVIFSKGGFVAVPVVLAAKVRHIPVIIHESDMTPGLANKICIPSATKVCCNFPETIAYLPEGKSVLTGSPIRAELYDGKKDRGLAFCGFTGEKPVILIMGGSQGSAAINKAVRAILPRLLEQFQVIHLCGKGNLEARLEGTPGYVQYEYIDQELSDLLAAADLVISRAGANAICELLALKKPAILIPLPSSASRGDQILNAQSFERQGYSYLLREEDITDEVLFDDISYVFRNRADYIEAMQKSGMNDAVETITDLIDEVQEKDGKRKAAKKRAAGKKGGSKKNTKKSTKKSGKSKSSGKSAGGKGKASRSSDKSGSEKQK